MFYVFRCLIDEQVPATSGLMRPITVIAPEGTIVNARPPAAVAGGNVETSQRMVDTLLRALSHAIPNRIPAASQGTMNNLTFGGIDPRDGAPFAYYETIAGGMGARPGKDGASGIHTHMTNSLNTPVEVLEHTYPVRVLRYGLRHGSGGCGKSRGGDGVVREIELLTDMHVGFLSDRRKIPPYGLHGGQPGATGKNEWIIAGKGKSGKEFRPRPHNAFKMRILRRGWFDDSNRISRRRRLGQGKPQEEFQPGEIQQFALNAKASIQKIAGGSAQSTSRAAHPAECLKITTKSLVRLRLGQVLRHLQTSLGQRLNHRRLRVLFRGVPGGSKLADQQILGPFQHLLLAEGKWFGPAQCHQSLQHCGYFHQRSGAHAL